MPFTLSHPAAVIPLAKTRLNLSALVVGSMSPDFIYFISLVPHGEATHTLAGIFLYCLPAGLLVFLIYHMFLKMPLQSMLPSPACQPVGTHWGRPFNLQTIRKVALVMISLVIGAFTHVAWDAFTHENGWMVKFLPFLDVTAFDLGIDRVPLTRILHHSSSIIGALWIILWSRRQMRRMHGKSDGGSASGTILGKTYRTMTIWTSLSVVAGLLYAWTQGYPVQNNYEFRQMMVQALVAAGSAFFSITLLYSLIWHMTKKRVPDG